MAKTYEHIAENEIQAVYNQQLSKQEDIAEVNQLNEAVRNNSEAKSQIQIIEGKKESYNRVYGEG